MKFVPLAVLLSVAVPVCAQVSQPVTVEQASSAISGELIQPLHDAILLEAPPPARPLFKTARTKPALREQIDYKLFWLHSSAFAGSMALDAWSTSRLVNFYRGHVNSPIAVPGICTEGNPSLGRTPTDGRIAGYFLAWTSGEVAATYLLKRATRHFKPSWAHESWRLPITYLTAYHTFWGATNLNRCR